jgi:hypothetical protein
MLTVRAANIADAATIRKLISELADYEKRPGQVRTTEGDILRDGFGESSEFRVLLAEWHGMPVGLRFSSAITQPGVAGDFIWRTFLFGLRFADEELGKHCLQRWPGWRSRRNASSCGGLCWTGINPRSRCIGRWVPIFSTSGELLFLRETV